MYRKENKTSKCRKQCPGKSNGSFESRDQRGYQGVPTPGPITGDSDGWTGDHYAAV